MKLTTLQKSRILERLTKEFAGMYQYSIPRERELNLKVDAVIIEMTEEANKDINPAIVIEKAIIKGMEIANNHMSKAEENDERAGSYIERYAAKTLQHLVDDVHDINQLGQLRRLIRRLRIWRGVGADPNSLYDEAYGTALEDIMDITKHMMKGKDVKGFYQTSVCIECKRTLKNTNTTVVQRGVIHNSCIIPKKPRQV